MGLSSKQVSSDGLDWTQNLLLQNGGLELPKPPQARQQHEQQSSPLRCPRCDSTNTKFCYYNNYNRSQPRHFCKACRRHWTKGGTLRNVPVGGGRKNKRLKTTKNDQNNNNNNTPNIQVIQQQQQQLQQLPVEFGHQKNISNVLYRALLQSPPPPTPLLPNYINSTTTTTTTTNDNSNASSSSSSMNCFAASPLLLRRPLPPLPQFPTFTTMSSLESDPSSSSFAGHSQFYSNYAASTAEDTLFDSQLSPWQIPTTSSYLDSTHWNWEDLSLFISPDPKKRPPPPPEDSQFSLLGM